MPVNAIISWMSSWFPAQTGAGLLLLARRSHLSFILSIISFNITFRSSSAEKPRTSTHSRFLKGHGKGREWDGWKQGRVEPVDTGRGSHKDARQRGERDRARIMNEHMNRSTLSFTRYCLCAIFFSSLSVCTIVVAYLSNCFFLVCSFAIQADRTPSSSPSIHSRRESASF